MLLPALLSSFIPEPNLTPYILGDKDYEKQEHRKLTRAELIKVALAGEVGEAQWVAAVALGLLHDEHKEHH